MRIFRALFGLLAVWMIVAPLACGSAPTSTGSLGVAGAGGGSSSTVASSSSGEVGGFTASSSSGEPCPLHCSSDLHQVADCHDMLVTTCPSDQGCSMGACVSACDAAKEMGSTVGCEFFSVAPAPYKLTAGSCFAALVTNTWNAPITIKATYGGVALDVASIGRIPTGSGVNLTYEPFPNGELPPGKIGLLFLSDSPSADPNHMHCPKGVKAGLDFDTAVEGSRYGKAFRIESSAPMIAYDVYPYGAGATIGGGATLLVPTSAWGTNYVAADGYATTPFLVGDNGLPFIQIVAAEDGTDVTIRPTASILVEGQILASPKGVPVTYTLQKGEFLQFQQFKELAGSPISSTKPISVWGGSACMEIPVGDASCDTAHQELLPVSSLGHEYLAVPYTKRIGEPLMYWTLVGAVDGTALIYDPMPPQNAPSSLNLGDVALVTSASDMPFSVRSADAQHPFYLAEHMTGFYAQVNEPYIPVGAPETMGLVPPEHWLRDYLFLTDPTYETTELVVVRRKAKDGTFKDVSVDCAGVLAGWSKVDMAGDFEFTRLDLVKVGVPMGACDNGVHTATSEAAFGLTVWGWGTMVSYAYPAGMSVIPINDVVVPAVPN